MGTFVAPWRLSWEGCEHESCRARHCPVGSRRRDCAGPSGHDSDGARCSAGAQRRPAGGQPLGASVRRCDGDRATFGAVPNRSMAATDARTARPAVAVVDVGAARWRLVDLAAAAAAGDAQASPAGGFERRGRPFGWTGIPRPWLRIRGKHDDPGRAATDARADPRGASDAPGAPGRGTPAPHAVGASAPDRLTRMRGNLRLLPRAPVAARSPLPCHRPCLPSTPPPRSARLPSRAAIGWSSSGKRWGRSTRSGSCRWSSGSCATLRCS